MPWAQRIRHCLKTRLQELRRREFEHDLEQEIQSHLQLETDRNLEAGMPPTQARDAARKKFGPIARAKEETRQQTGFPFWQTLAQDLRFAVRLTKRTPAFTALIVLTLALGLGAATAMYSVIHAVLLAPLPFPEPDRLMVLWQSSAQEGWQKYEVAPANFYDWQRETRAFSELAAVQPFASASMTTEARAEQFEGSAVTHNYFSTLGVEARYGRTFAPSDGETGDARIVVLSHHIWQQRFDGDPQLVGRTIKLNGEAHLVIGILPPDFPNGVAVPDLETSQRSIDFWRPLNLDEYTRGIRSFGALRVIGRLAPGVTPSQAQADMDAISGRLAEAFPDTNEGWGVQIVPLHEQTVGDVSAILMLLFAAVGIVLLASCANVAGMLLARATARRREIAIRRVLGASLGRLLRQLFTESLALALAAGLLGLLLARWLLPMALSWQFLEIPRHNEIRIDGYISLLALAAALLTAILFGLAPSLQAIREAGGGATHLKATASTATSSRQSRTLGAFLVAFEVALCCLLMVGAALLLNSVWRLRAVDPGFQTQRLLTFRMGLPRAFSQPEREFRSIHNLLLDIPAAEAVGASTSVPFMKKGEQAVIPYQIETDFAAPGDTLGSARAVTPGYFRTLGIPLRQGRWFTLRDDGRAKPVIIVNESLARQAWPGESPLGKRIAIAEPDGRPVWREVVGVVANVRSFGLDEDEQPGFYVPYEQLGTQWLVFAVRARQQSASALVPAIRRALAAAYPDVPISSVQTMESRIDDWLAPRQTVLTLLSVLAALAVAMAAAGLYGVLSWQVAAQKRELAIRIALGSTRSGIVWLMLRRTALLSALGAVVGLATSAVLGRFVSALLYQVEPLDFPTYAAVALLLALVALFATAAPLARAARLDPLSSLREE